jgi:hypothetical protein
MANFSDLLASKQASLAATAATPMMLSLNLDDNIAVASDEESFQKSDKYLWYDEYFDDEYSIIDKQKNITIGPNQINLTQEENSQVIPFQLDRFYDGMDLMKMFITVYFVNKDGQDIIVF